MKIGDHVGQSVTIGDYISFAGAGNKTAEYGMITGKVIKINPNQIIVERLKATYNNSKATISKQKIRKSLGKFVKVDVCDEIDYWFNLSSFDEFQSARIASWLHHGAL